MSQEDFRNLIEFDSMFYPKMLMAEEQARRMTQDELNADNTRA